jgi:hypothetical protein
MKGYLKVLFITLIMLSMLMPLQAKAKDVVIKKPPESLDKFYPPLSKKPEFIIQMHKMSTNFGGVFVNMGEKDWENAVKRGEQLEEEYKKTSKMVPEWKDYFNLEAAASFAKAVKTRDPKQIGKASQELGKTCGSCHAENSIAVWTRYHWPSVKSIKIVDPVSEKELEYGKYMKGLSGAFKGVTVNFGENQYDRAGKALNAFQKKYIELRSTCSKCHTNDIVKQFFVGDNITAAMSNMKKELTSAKPNIGNFWKNVGIVGKQGCKMCHLTHRAYSIIQGVWEQKK